MLPGNFHSLRYRINSYIAIVFNLNFLLLWYIEGNEQIPNDIVGSGELYHFEKFNIIYKNRNKRCERNTDTFL